MRKKLIKIEKKESVDDGSVQKAERVVPKG